MSDLINGIVMKSFYIWSCKKHQINLFTFNNHICLLNQSTQSFMNYSQTIRMYVVRIFSTFYAVHDEYCFLDMSLFILGTQFSSLLRKHFQSLLLSWPNLFSFLTRAVMVGRLVSSAINTALSCPERVLLIGGDSFLGPSIKNVVSRKSREPEEKNNN